MNCTKVTKLIFVLIICCLLCIAGCDSKPDSAGTEPSDISSDNQNEPAGAAWPYDHFETSTPEAQGMSSEKLNELFTAIKRRGLDIHHLMIIRNGYVVTNCDFYPYTSDNLHVLNSVTKGFTSAGVGKAIDDGHIKSVDDKFVDYYKDVTLANPSDYKSMLSIEDLLTMTAGFEWSEDGNYGADYDSYTQMIRSGNPIDYIINQPVTTKPGTEFYYNTGASYLLSGIITKATGLTASEYIYNEILKPIGVKDYFWNVDAQGITSGGSALMLTPEDLAKFGYLYLNNGVWDGKTILPEEWVKDSTLMRHETPRGLAGRYGYAYQWWMNDFGGYSGRGYKGQYLFVIPEENMIVVFNSFLLNSFFAPEQFVRDYILEAIIDDKAIEENDEAFESLSNIIMELESEPQKTAVDAPPEITQHTNNNRYEQDNGQIIGIDFMEGSSEAMLYWFVDNIQYDVPVGLDNLYRVTDCFEFLYRGHTSPVGFRGEWTNSTTFAVDIRPLEGDSAFILTLEFTEDNITSSFRQKSVN